MGIVLIILFVAYLLYPILLDRKKIVEEYKKEKKNPNTQTNKKNTFLQICYIIIGIALLKYGGDLVVDNATIIAQIYGVTERIIGLTIVAIGTALPELITSIVASISNDADIAVGNLIGSSVLNSFLILGIGAIIAPITISEEFIVNLILLSASTTLIWLFCYIPKKNVITRPKGMVLISIFAVYMISLFMQKCLI